MEGGEDVVFREVNGKVDDLPVQLLEGVVVDFREGVLEGEGDVVVVDVVGVGRALLHGPDVDDIPVLQLLQYAQLALQQHLLSLVAELHSLLHQYLPRFVVLPAFPFDLAEWKLAALH